MNANERRLAAWKIPPARRCPPPHSARHPKAATASYASDLSTNSLLLLNINKEYMQYSVEIDAKVNEIYSKHAVELEKDHEGEIVAIDLINESIFDILRQDKITELIKTLKNTKNRVAFRKIGSKEAVFHFR